MIGHLGARVSALLDGQLAPGEEERCWEHVHACHACRDLVEREGWVKARLSGLDAAGGRAAGLPAPLARALRDPDVAGREPASVGLPGLAGHVGPLSHRSARPALVALGALGTAAASLGIALLVFVPGGADDLRPPASRLPGNGSAVDPGPPQPVLPGHRFVPVGRAAR